MTWFHGKESKQVLDIRLSASSAKPLLPDDCALQYLSHVDTRRIPLQLICGPRIDVWTTSPETEAWFSNLLLSGNDAADAEQDWWQNAILESSMGILAALQYTDTTTTPQPRITEILFYAAQKCTQVSPPTPPQTHASSSHEFGLYALPLSSDLLLHNDADITPPSSPVLVSSDTTVGRFIPHPWDQPSARQKRKSALNSTFDAADERRRSLKRHHGVSVAAAAAANNVPVPPVPRLKSEASGAREARGTVPILNRPKSRSPSIASLRRETTLPEARRVSGLSRATPAPATNEEEDSTAKANKDTISKVVLAGLRVWGFTASSKRKKHRSSMTTAESQLSVSDSLTAEEEARDEEYKLLYHNVYKACAFAFRTCMANTDLSSPQHAEKVRDTVDSLLAIFCKDPLEERDQGGGGEEKGVGKEFKGALVRTPKTEEDKRLGVV